MVHPYSLRPLMFHPLNSRGFKMPLSDRYVPTCLSQRKRVRFQTFVTDWFVWKRRETIRKTQRTVMIS
jgi:hypothetical protein